jgi:hypothetical protein
MTPAEYRAAIGDAICTALIGHTGVAAVWEGGSAATGRLDEYSDIDVVIVAGLEAALAIFDAVEHALSGVDRIVHTWRVESPPFRDTAQRFYFLAGAPRFFAVDCVVVTETAAPQSTTAGAMSNPNCRQTRSHRSAAMRFVADGLALKQMIDELGAELLRQLETVSASLRDGPPSR